MKLRHQFGNYAGGLAHALALATLAQAEHRTPQGGMTAAHSDRASLFMPDADSDARMIALLHEVVSDTDLTVEDLRAEGFPDHIVDAVSQWSSRAGTPSFSGVEQLARYRSAQRILDTTSHPAQVAAPRTAPPSVPLAAQ